MESTLMPNSSRSRRTGTLPGNSAPSRMGDLPQRPAQSALEKAIARNRSKDISRNMQTSQGRVVNRTSNHQQMGGELSLQKKIELKKAELMARRSARESQQQSNTSSNFSKPISNLGTSASREISKSPERTGVARPGTGTFNRSLTRKTSPKVKTTYKKKKVSKAKNEELSIFALWGLRVLWAFAFYLVIRLFFTQGGVVDFYRKLTLLDDSKVQLSSIVEENLALKTEIKEMRTNKRLQKKLVRDNLGYIAENEFMVIFPNKVSSIDRSVSSQN